MPIYNEADDEFELTDAEINRQDLVDGAIYDMVKSLMINNSNEDEPEWDIEWIAELREAVEHVIVDVLKDQTEMEFYPYIELEGE